MCAAGLHFLRFEGWRFRLLDSTLRRCHCSTTFRIQYVNHLLRTTYDPSDVSGERGAKQALARDTGIETLKKAQLFRFPTIFPRKSRCSVHSAGLSSREKKVPSGAVGFPQEIQSISIGFPLKTTWWGIEPLREREREGERERGRRGRELNNTGATRHARFWPLAPPIFPSRADVPTTDATQPGVYVFLCPSLFHGVVTLAHVALSCLVFACSHVHAMMMPPAPQPQLHYRPPPTVDVNREAASNDGVAANGNGDGDDVGAPPLSPPPILLHPDQPPCRQENPRGCRR